MNCNSRKDQSSSLIGKGSIKPFLFIFYGERGWEKGLRLHAAAACVGGGHHYSSSQHHHLNYLAMISTVPPWPTTSMPPTQKLIEPPPQKLIEPLTPLPPCWFETEEGRVFEFKEEGVGRRESRKKERKGRERKIMK